MPASGSAGAIVFAHANGFPAGTYRLLFARWRAAGYAVLAIEKLGTARPTRSPATGRICATS